MAEEIGGLVGIPFHLFASALAAPTLSVSQPATAWGLLPSFAYQSWDDPISRRISEVQSGASRQQAFPLISVREMGFDHASAADLADRTLKFQYFPHAGIKRYFSKPSSHSESSIFAIFIT